MTKPGHPVLLMLMITLVGCARRNDLGAPAARDTIAAIVPSPTPADTLLPLGLALKDDGRTVQVAPGQVVMVSLKANHTTGYRWVLKGGALGVLARDGEPAYDVDSTSGIGAGGFELWRFRASKAGRGAIALEYRRPWEKGARPETTVRYVIDAR